METCTCRDLGWIPLLDVASGRVAPLASKRPRLRARDLFGLSVTQIIGETLHQLYQSDVADRLAANDDWALKVRQPIEAMEKVDTPNGPRVFRSIKFPIIGMDGHATMTGGFSVDMTKA